MALAPVNILHNCFCCNKFKDLIHSNSISILLTAYVGAQPDMIYSTAYDDSRHYQINDLQLSKFDYDDIICSRKKPLIKLANFNIYSHAHLINTAITKIYQVRKNGQTSKREVHFRAQKCKKERN